MSKTEMIEWIIRYAILLFSIAAGFYLAYSWEKQKYWQNKAWFVSFALVIGLIWIHAAGMLFIYYSR